VAAALSEEAIRLHQAVHARSLAVRHNAIALLANYQAPVDSWVDRLLVKVLDSPRASDRWEACEAISARGWCASVRKLTSILSADPSWVVRSCAVECLDTLKDEGGIEASLLHAARKDPHWAVRRDAWLAWSKKRNSQDLRRLMFAFESERNTAVRVEMAAILVDTDDGCALIEAVTRLDARSLLGYLGALRTFDSILERKKLCLSKDTVRSIVRTGKALGLSSKILHAFKVFYSRFIGAEPRRRRQC
jgi:hypothetical protein